MEKKARVIAFYLPQFHPIPENNRWWGEGFTEWTNVAKAKPLFRGHYQPRIPADLGFYDLRLPIIRKQQAEMARSAGIEGFCYWHYWFGNGKQLLETPFNEVLKTGEPDFPFCLAWANHSWTNKTWNTGKRFTKEGFLIEQTYPGFEEHIEHFNYLLPAFKDPRYLKIDNKPIFSIFQPYDIPNVKCFIQLWNKLAIENGLNGIYFIGIAQNMDSHVERVKKNQLNLIDKHYKNTPEICYKQILNLGFDAVNSRGIFRSEMLTKPRSSRYLLKLINLITDGTIVNKYDYSKIIKNIFVKEDKWENVFPTIIPNWDRSPRSGHKALIWHNSTPSLFYKHMQEALEYIKNKPNDKQVIFLQSWNEWGEGNYVEPDLKYGHGYLESIKNSLIIKKEEYQTLLK